MRGKLMLYRDQNGNCIWATTVRELRLEAGNGRIVKMFRDGTDGKSYHVGYVVGKRWFSAFIPMRQPA